VKKHYAFFIMMLFALPAVADNDCASLTTAPDTEMTLQNVVEMGLCRNPTTAAAYLSLESSRLNKNAEYSTYLPSVSASANIGENYQNRNWGEVTLGGSLSASWLIFDFGKRLADLNALSATWRATGFDYNESVQNYVYSVIGAYYGLLTADANVSSSESLLNVAKTARDTANKKFKAGAVARADVYKAETSLASRELDLERAKNNRENAKSTLLTLLSFPATDNIKIADISSEFGAESENKSIDELLETAKKQRPDLLAATENKNAAWHRRNASFLKNLPSISLSGSVGYNDLYDNLSHTSGDKVSGSIGIRASMPIFAGFANVYGVRAAEANYDAAKMREVSAQNDAARDIYSAYNNYKTAQKVLQQTKTLLKSATENEKVVSGMYKVGRAAMLEWQTAQSELVDASRQANDAKYDLYIKRAALAMAVGDLTANLGNWESNKNMYGVEPK
jgi:outer membrane protein TolC